MLSFLFLQIHDLKSISGFTDNMVSTFLKVTLDDGPGSTLSQCSSNMYIYYILNYRYHISSIFIGSPDACDLSMYLLYLIWSRNASAITQAEHFCSSEKKWRPKAVLHWNKNKMEELLTWSF